MKPWKLWLCRRLMWLNRLPGWRYIWSRDEKGDWAKGHWYWSRRGNYGIMIIDRLGMLDAYLDYVCRDVGEDDDPRP